MSGLRLVVVLDTRRVGVIERARGGRLRFTYDEDWRLDPRGLPLSLSMPVAAAAVEHGHEIVDAFLQGLLPDSDEVLRTWARRFGVLPRNPLALLAHVGEDCAGAVQLVREERLGAVLADDSWDVAWIDEAEVAERLALLESDHAAWRRPTDSGHFSLAGAQAKIALLHQDGRWGVPSGRAPTTHILKPPLPNFDGHVENEHLCLQLARELGLPSARSSVGRFGDRIAIVIERFDRLVSARVAAEAEAATVGVDPCDPRTSERQQRAMARAELFRRLAEVQPIVRLHQEDLCQALGVPPGSKYQHDGGPGADDVVALLRDHSSQPTEDVMTFVDALAFNWLIGGTDAHAKNYTLLHGGRGRVRLAPLYDVASVLPYDDIDVWRIKLAMKVGGKYRVRDIGRRQWESLARENRLDASATVERIADLARRMSGAARRVGERAAAQGLEHPLMPRLLERLEQRAGECLRLLEGPARPA